MPVPAKGSTILVTGASGFIAMHCIDSLFKEGYKVVGTVRSTEKGEYIKDLFKGKDFKYVIVEDIEKEDSFEGAVDGIEGVLHTASPFHLKAETPEELIGPAVNGTLGILKASAKKGDAIKRVVITSSVAAILYPVDKPKTFTEDDWNEYSNEHVKEKGNDAEKSHMYRASKTLAEKAAWKFVKEEKPAFDIATINPPMVFGPILQQCSSPDHLNTSVASFYKIVSGQYKKEDLPGPGGSWVDVREVADAHVQALITPEAGGQRFLTSAGPYCNQDFADALIKFYPDLKGVPKGEAGAAKAANSPEKVNILLGTKPTKVLGIKFRSIEDTTKDMYQSLAARGWGGETA